MLEVCIDSLESAINAIHGGADELEVCSSLPEGGLTPTPGLVKEILKMVNNIPYKKKIYKTCLKCSCENDIKKPKVNIMIRCRAGSDFCYTEEEIDTMLSDVEYYKTLGVDRFVFGALTSRQDVDKDTCSKIVLLAHPTPVTFHRAFDICRTPHIAMNEIIQLGFNRLLTSGQQSSAGDANAKILIKELINNYHTKIHIMPGAGINAENAKQFIVLGCKIVHSSCKQSKQIPLVENKLTMGTNSSGHIYCTDESIVKELKLVLSS